MKSRKNKIMIIILLGFAALLLLALLPVSIRRFALARELKAGKVVAYEGPVSLPAANEDDLKNTAEKNRRMDLLRSSDFSVNAGGTDLFVYETNVNHTRSWVANYYPPQGRTPVACFDLEGAARLTVSSKLTTIEKAEVLPHSKGVTAKINRKDNSVSFIIKEQGDYTVVFNDSHERALHLFVSSIEEGPAEQEEGLIYFGPGEWNIGQVSLESETRVYIAGGAVVHGCFNANYAHGITIEGRGIIDGSMYEGWKGREAYIPLKFDHCRDITIKGVTVLNPNAWVCQAFDSENGLIKDVKIISSRPNGDGITLQSCKDYTVSDCFVRSWDDSLVVKNYDRNSENITFSDCTIWTDLAQSMEIGYETNKGKKEDAFIKGVTFKDITVLNNFHKPVISVHNADDAAVSDILFENITVEHEEVGSGDGSEMPYLIDINIAESSNWSATKERGTVNGVTLRNVRFLEGNHAGSRIAGYDADHKAENIVFEDLYMFGEKIENAEDGLFEIKEGTVGEITWK